MEYWIPSGSRNQTGLQFQTKVWICHSHKQRQTDDAEVVSRWIRPDWLMQARPSSHKINKKKGESS